MNYLNRRYYTILIGLICFILFISSSLNNIEVYKKSLVSQIEKLYLPILMYHQVKENGVGKDVITQSEFEADLIYLKENNYNTITMQDLLDFVYNNKLLPENPIILTFDDGYLTTYKYVFSLLKKYDMKIVLSIIGISTDKFSKVLDENIEYSHITWNQLNEMLESGLVEVQNHTYNMHSYSSGRKGCSQKKGECYSDYQSVLSEDLELLQNKIYEKTGEVPNTVTYPYGAYNDSTIEIIKQNGFKAALSCRYGVNVVSREMNLFELRRICRAHGESAQKLLADIKKIINN